MELGNNIRNIRKQRGLRQEQLAEAMGVSVAAVSKWETNQSFPELTMLAELADFFEVSIDTLVGHNLNADRMEALINQLEDAGDHRDEERVAVLCEKILRNYPNDARAVEACVKGYYYLYIYTSKKNHMERCIAETKRLMNLKQGEPERERLARIHYLGNQYGHLGQWDTAKEYYEQSNVMGCNDAAIAECLLKQGKSREAVTMASDVLMSSVFEIYGAVNTMVVGWTELGEHKKACAALEWMYGLLESLHYNPTTMVLIQVQLAGFYGEQGEEEAARAAIRKAAELAKEDSRQEYSAGAEFLQIEEAKKIVTNAPEDNRAMIRYLAEQMGHSYIDVVDEVLE